MSKKLYKTFDNDENNILHFLIKQNKKDKIKIILEKGLKYNFNKYIINKQNNEGLTPLHLAVKNKYFSIANLLIDYGANKNFINCFGQKIKMSGGGNNIYFGKRYI